MERVLSFDISSANVGFAVLEQSEEKEINLIHSGVIKPKKDGSIFFRLSDLKQEVSKLFETYQPTTIAIEEIVQYMKGASTAQTIIVLTSFNRTIGLLAYEYLNKDPEMLNILTIRSKLKVNNITPDKASIPDNLTHYVKNMPNFPWIMTKNKIDKSSYDMADAIAVGVAYFVKKQEPIKKKK